MQVYADHGSLLGSQEEAADLASRLTAAESREAVLKATLADEQASRRNEAELASARATKATADLQASADKVLILGWLTLQMSHICVYVLCVFCVQVS